jgi:3D (Asp-Asp-Asp) domain-containing protein
MVRKVMTCISAVANNNKPMTRYFYSICILFSMMGLPMWGKTVVSTAALSSKMQSKGVLAPVPAPAKTVAQKTVVPKAPLLTSDRTRATAAALIASRPVTGTHATPTFSRADSSLAYSVTEAPLQGRLISAFPPPASASRPEVRSDFHSEIREATSRLARVTAYWASEGDYYTGRGLSATGVRLHEGLCAVDPNIIPYGSVVEIAGVGKYLAVDTGSAVVDRTAAREGGHTMAERGAIVVDIFFESRLDGERFAANAAKYVTISWWTPMATNTLARAARSLFAEEDWAKIQSKQL